MTTVVFDDSLVTDVMDTKYTPAGTWNAQWPVASTWEER